jgi:transcriptional regulator with XRE-family HTH domain
MQPTEIAAAVKRLRVALGDTQQSFAGRLNLAISTVVRYETSRPPSGRYLLVLRDIAREASAKPKGTERATLTELADLFHRAWIHELDKSADRLPQTTVEEDMAYALLLSLRNPLVPEIGDSIPRICRMLQFNMAKLARLAQEGQEIPGTTAGSLAILASTLEARLDPEFISKAVDRMLASDKNQGESQ